MEAYLYLLPALLFVGIFLLYPAGYTLYISLTKWDGLTSPIFVGIQNYIQIVTEPIFKTSGLNTLIWVAATLLLPVSLGLALAVLINRIPLQGFFKSAFYLPYAVSATSAGVIWGYMLSPNGVINAILENIGLENAALSWLITPPWHTVMMIIAYTWLSAGTYMILFLVGLQNIPHDPIEAAKLDGANGRQLFWHITFPLLRPVTTVVVTIAIVNSFKVFDMIWVMTQGGPYRSSETLAVTMYRESFVLFNLGYGAAIANMLSIVIIIFSIVYLRSIFRQEN
ncbi:MAG: sugar ABC transporter permease [Chloroflexi bacterium]|nr:MAG: sugar ABC transporter permease [Chloroflexota bacterium]